MGMTMVSSNEGLDIAILVQNDASNETVVRYRHITGKGEDDQNGDSIVTFDELPHSYFVSSSKGNDIRHKDQGSQKQASSKLFQSSYAATYDATTFLSDEFPRFQSQKKKKKSSKTTPGTPLISTGQAALMLSRDNSSDSTFRTPQYHAVTFSLPRSKVDPITETTEIRNYRELLMIRQPGLQRSGPMSLSKDLWSFEAFDVVEMCTGMCLFSEQDLDLCIQNGVIQPARLAQLPISLCEKEIIIRLSTTIANTVGLYFHGCETRRQRALHINVDIPSVQYYKDALESYSDGKCTPEDVLQWISAIRDRRRMLFDAFARAIEYGLDERCVPTDGVSINLSCGLKAADEGIFCALRVSPTPRDWLQHILCSVLGDGNEFWTDFMNLVEEKEQIPNTWRQLSTLSYMYEVARPVLRARMTIQMQPLANEYFSTSQKCSDATQNNTTSAAYSSEPTPTKRKDLVKSRNKSQSASTTRILLLAIDDVDESRIYTKAYQSLCRLSTASARSPGVSSTSSIPVTTRILTICPAPHIVCGTSISDPSWSRPSLWRATLRSNEIKDPVLRFRDEDQSLRTDSDILKEVYDKDLVTLLDSCVKK